MGAHAVGSEAHLELVGQGAVAPLSMEGVARPGHRDHGREGQECSRLQWIVGHE